MRVIDLNCDVGEGIGNDALLMPFLSSCSIACGGHFGTAATIDATIELAVKSQVKIGAHPSFPDPLHFGRKLLDISKDALRRSIASQLALFSERLAVFQVKMHHVKAHGALYNFIAKDTEAAENYVHAIEPYIAGSCLYVPYNSAIAEVATAQGIEIVYEAFADRNYNTDLSLVARTHKEAVLSTPAAVCAHVKHMIESGCVVTTTGSSVPIKAGTLCIHGDHEHSVEIVKELRYFLHKRAIRIE